MYIFMGMFISLDYKICKEIMLENGRSELFLDNHHGVYSLSLYNLVSSRYKQVSVVELVKKIECKQRNGVDR